MERGLLRETFALDPELEEHSTRMPSRGEAVAQGGILGGDLNARLFPRLSGLHEGFADWEGRVAGGESSFRSLRGGEQLTADSSQLGGPRPEA